jgi:hypothetical protein
MQEMRVETREYKISRVVFCKLFVEKAGAKYLRALIRSGLPVGYLESVRERRDIDPDTHVNILKTSGNKFKTLISKDLSDS